LIEAGLVDLEQVFLPYAQNAAGQTVYDVMKSQRVLELAPGGIEAEARMLRLRISRASG
jgi:hypothetical protein